MQVSVDILTYLCVLYSTTLLLIFIYSYFIRYIRVYLWRLWYIPWALALRQMSSWISLSCWIRVERRHWSVYTGFAARIRILICTVRTLHFIYRYIDIYAGLCNYVGTYAGSVSLGTYLAFTNRSTRVHIRHRRFWKISRERAWNRVGGGGETSFRFFDLPRLRVGTHHSIISICWVMYVSRVYI